MSDARWDGWIRSARYGEGLSRQIVVVRSLSYSEISTALTCQARWSFGYGGHLTNGKTLHRKQIASRLSDGRAWGAGVARWHAAPCTRSLFQPVELAQARIDAHVALAGSYEADVLEQAESGIYVPVETFADRVAWLSEVLDHYMTTAPRLNNLTRLEGELDIPLPSRTGRRVSTKYHFNGFLDGFTCDEQGDEWIVEFKFRDSLLPVEMIQLSRQVRWYAWSRQRETGAEIVGAIVDERIAEAPKPPRIVKAKRKGEGIDGLVPSHAVDQLCRPEDYIAVCQEFGVDPRPEALAAMEARRWQQRVPILFRPGELEEAGKELVSAAKLIRDLDSGELYPVRNSQPQLCRNCRYKEACPNPQDEYYLSTIFDFTEPKRLRLPPEVVAEAA